MKDVTSLAHMAILSIALGCPLGCARSAVEPGTHPAAAVEPGTHPAPAPGSSCVLSGPNDPHARAYTAVVPTADGGSAFEDRALCLEERPVTPGEPPVELLPLSAPGPALFLRSRPFNNPPHHAPRRQWVLPLRGTFQVTVSDGTSRRFVPGDLILVTDTTGTGHATTGIGDPPFELLFVPAN